MDLNRLLEVRSSGLSKMGSINFLDAAADHPIELLRLAYQKLDNAGFETLIEDRRKQVNKFKESDSPSSLSHDNYWFSDSQFHVDITGYAKGESVVIQFRIDRNKLFVVTKASWNDFPSTINLSGKTVDQVLDPIIEEAKELFSELDRSKMTSPQDYEEMERKARELQKSRQKKLSFEKPLKALAKKNGFSLKVERSHGRDRGIPNLYRFQLEPSLELWGVGSKYSDSSIRKHLSYDLLGSLEKFTHKFQFENAAKVLPHILRKIRGQNFTIVEGPRWGNNFIWFDARTVNPETRIPDTREKRGEKQITYKEREERAMRNFMEALREKQEEAEGTKSEIQQRIIQDLLSEKEEE